MNTLGPILIGLCGAAVIIGARWVLLRVLLRPSHRKVKHTVFFGLMFLLTAAAAVYVRDEIMLQLGMGVISLICLWATLGSALTWPGFRDPPAAD